MAIVRICGVFLVATTFFLCSAASSGLCSVTGLLIIPVAETVGAGTYSGECQTDGVITGRAIDAVVFNNEYGIGDRFEIGLDLVPHGDDTQRMLGNFKYIIASSPRKGFAMGVGVADIARHTKPTLFATTRVHTSAGAFHFGPMSIDGKPCAFIGYDRIIGDVKFMCDYTTGKRNPASIGFGYQFNSLFGIEAGLLLNGSSESTGFTVHLVWNKDLRAE
ncbi:MAG: hypothetical protein ACOX3G_10475 [Armatimonadota bacterium]|jgi:hypothetical protein